MVRKWSYITHQNFTKPNVFRPVIKTKSLKVFKKTTRFKKFTKGITKVVRKKYTKRVFFSTYLVLTHISKWWAFNFMQAKQILRFTQSFGWHEIVSYIPNNDVFKEFNKPSEKVLNFQLFSCSKSLLYNFIYKSQMKNSTYFGKPFFVKSSIKNVKTSLAQTTSLNSLADNKDVIYTQNIFQENLSYHPYTENADQLSKHTLNSIITTLTKHNLQLAVEYYKILIKLVLLKL